MKGNKYSGGSKKRKKIIFEKDKGKAYSDVSREIENTFAEWILFAGVSAEEFDRRMKRKPHKIEENINSAGEVEINIYAGNENVIAPLVFQGGDIKSLDNFLVDVLFLLSFVASRYEDKSFENAVKGFMEKMILQKKLTL